MPYKVFFVANVLAAFVYLNTQTKHRAQESYQMQISRPLSSSALLNVV